MSVHLGPTENLMSLSFSALTLKAFDSLCSYLFTSVYQQCFHVLHYEEHLSASLNQAESEIQLFLCGQQQGVCPPADVSLFRLVTHLSELITSVSAPCFHTESGSKRGNAFSVAPKYPFLSIN